MHQQHELVCLFIFFSITFSFYFLGLILIFLTALNSLLFFSSSQGMGMVCLLWVSSSTAMTARLKSYARFQLVLALIWMCLALNFSAYFLPLSSEIVLIDSYHYLQESRSILLPATTFTASIFRHSQNIFSQTYRFSSVDSLVTSQTKIAQFASFRQFGMRLLNRSCPAVSQS